MKRPSPWPLILLALTLVAHYSGAVRVNVPSLPRLWPIAPAVTPAVPTPAADLQTIVAPVRATLSGHSAEAREVAAVYKATASVLDRDAAAGPKAVIASTSTLRELLGRAGQLATQGTGFAGRVPGLADALDKALADGLGLTKSAEGYENKPLDEPLRRRAADTCRAIAWAAGG